MPKVCYISAPNLSPLTSLSFSLHTHTHTHLFTKTNSPDSCSPWFSQSSRFTNWYRIKYCGAQEVTSHRTGPAPRLQCWIRADHWVFLETLFPSQEIASLAAGTLSSFPPYFMTRGTYKSRVVPQKRSNHHFPVTSATALQFILKPHSVHRVNL